MASEESLLQMVKFLRLRKEHKLQEFSQSHRKIFNTFHLPVWKRIFDILFAVAVLIVLSPILIATAIAIRVESKGRVIYKSQRVGSNYQIFNFLKFRSMYTNADKRLKELNALNQYKIEEELTDEQPDIRFDDLTGTSEEEATLLISDDFVISEEDFLKKKAQEKQNTFVKIENDPRVTRVGRFIRKYSIDELPQLFTSQRRHEHRGQPPAPPLRGRAADQRRIYRALHGPRRTDGTVASGETRRRREDVGRRAQATGH